MWIQPYVGLCWSVGLAGAAFGDNITNFSAHSWPIQHFPTMANRSDSTCPSLEIEVLLTVRHGKPNNIRHNKGKQLAGQCFFADQPCLMTLICPWIFGSAATCSLKINAPFGIFYLYMVFMIHIFKSLDFTELILSSLSCPQVGSTYCANNMLEWTFLILYVEIVLL